MVWLEDQKVRHYKVDERDALRETNSPKWTETFAKYLQDLGCPLLNRELPELVDWLLGLAVRLEYSDNGMVVNMQPSHFLCNIVCI